MAEDTGKTYSRLGSDDNIRQVARVLALLFHATYPGEATWRYKTACRMLARGATAALALDDGEDLSFREWLSTAVSILMMESKNGLYEWCAFSPREQTEIATAFLPAAKALVDWVNAIRKRDAKEQECDWQDISFVYDAPEGVIMSKLDGYANDPDVELLKQLLFTENERCETIYNPLFFKQIAHGLDLNGGDIDYDEPSSSQDIQECNAVIKALYEYRAKQEERKDEKIPTLAEKSLQEIMEDLSESNEPYLEMKRQKNAEMARMIDEKAAELGFPVFSDVDCPATGATDKASTEPEAQEVAAGEQKPSEERARQVETKGRFRTSRYEDRIVVEDTQNDLSYTIVRPSGNAAKAILTLIADYAAGNRQLHNSNRKLVGAFQSGRGDATRFRKEQVFMLPKWNTEKRRYVDGQYCGKWRLWTDAEMKLPSKRRLADHKKEFPGGCPWQR